MQSMFEVQNRRNLDGSFLLKDDDFPSLTNEASCTSLAPAWEAHSSELETRDSDVEQGLSTQDSGIGSSSVSTCSESPPDSLQVMAEDQPHIGFTGAEIAQMEEKLSVYRSYFSLPVSSWPKSSANLDDSYFNAIATLEAKLKYFLRPTIDVALASTRQVIPNISGEVSLHSWLKKEFEQNELRYWVLDPEVPDRFHNSARVRSLRVKALDTLYNYRDINVRACCSFKEGDYQVSSYYLFKIQKLKALFIDVNSAAANAIYNERNIGVPILRLDLYGLLYPEAVWFLSKRLSFLHNSPMTKPLTVITGSCTELHESLALYGESIGYRVCVRGAGIFDIFFEQDTQDSSAAELTG